MNKKCMDLRLIDKLFLLFTFFVNEDILLFGTINNNFFVNLRFAIQIILVAVLFIYTITNRIPVNKKRLNIYILFLIIILSSMFINRDFRSGYFYLLIIYLTCFLLTSLYSFDQIYSIFSKSMVIISAVSIIGFLIQLLIPSLLNCFPIIDNVNYHHFYFLGLTNVSFKYDSFIRNWGPFREPGVFQAFIIIAIIYCLFRNKKVNLFEIIILSLALITTFSTTGYIAFLLILLACLSSNKNSMNKEQVRIIYMVLILAIFGLIYMTFFTDLMYKQGYGSVFGKLFGAYESDSYSARKLSFLVNIRIFFENIICGKGITYVDTMFKYYAQHYYGILVNDNTNMLFIQLAKYGLPMFIYTIIRYCKTLSHAYNNGAFSKVIIVLSYFILMFGENLSYSVLINLPMFFIASDFYYKN